MTEFFSYTACRQVLQLFLAIIFFHVSEYFLAIFFHGRSNVTLRSLLLSKTYILAMTFALLEYCLEVYFFPGLKEHWWISNIGLAILVMGEVIRKMAIITAGQAFTHLIKIYHEEHHKLVTSGVYSFVRHPGYCGFFIWSIGTQIMMCNPISTVTFAVVVWSFFARRIPYEEYFLRQFFWVRVWWICPSGSFWCSICEMRIYSYCEVGDQSSCDSERGMWREHQSNWYQEVIAKMFIRWKPLVWWYHSPNIWNFEFSC